MPSPFPGMNPYLEQDTTWHGFHQHFIPALAEALVAQVRPKYVVKLEEHVFVHHRSDQEPIFIGKPDVLIANDPAEPRSIAGGGTIVAPAYASMKPAVDIERLSYLEVLDREDMRPITVIELLSMSNKKSGRDREAYITKRDRLLNSGIHLVELDLLRGGPRMPMEELPDCQYYAMVSRAEDRPSLALWPLMLPDPLPTIPIPLADDDEPATINLQLLLHRVYDGGGYGDYIYRRPPQPRLNPRDAQWATQFLAPK